MIRESIDRRCWAGAYGECSGSITEEHVISKGLLGKRMKIRGGPFGSELSDLSVAALKAPILCKGHNNEFGRTADLAAQQLVRHLETSRDPLRLPGSRILRPPVAKRLSGIHFGRWLCKTHCNLMVINGMTPNPAYMAYAVQAHDRQPIYFYFPGAVGESLRLVEQNGPKFQWSQIISAGHDARFDGFQITLSGLPTVVSTRPLSRGPLPMLDRMKTLEWQTALGRYQIHFNWDTNSVNVSEA
jgi:hypothetical protein